MRRFLYTLLQLTWGLPQTLAGLVVLLLCRARGCAPGSYRLCVATEWPGDRGVSLGLFIFVPHLPDGPSRRLKAHEYGHTIQSLILGPLYVPVILIPSLVWAGTPRLERRRVRRGTSYYSFYTEHWANALVFRLTGETPMGW